MDLNRFDQSREFRQKLLDGFQSEAVDQALLRSFEHILIFQK
jgi:hypothetical protein